MIPICIAGSTWKWISVGEKRRTLQTFPTARPKYLTREVTNLNRIYKVHQTNVWWIMKVFLPFWNEFPAASEFCKLSYRPFYKSCSFMGSLCMRHTPLWLGLDYWRCLLFCTQLASFVSCHIVHFINPVLLWVPCAWDTHPYGLALITEDAYYSVHKSYYL